MDVKCERCNTEYEFDDALVSGRGTTVKCTNCGHKFKIRRSDGDFSEDFWNVTTGDGRTLVFTSLRELQRAIQGYLVERNDRLSRGGLPPKAIGQIPELAPFFEQREAAKKSGQPQRPVKTQDGLGPAAAAAAAAANAGPARPRQPTKPEFPAPPNDGTPGSQALGKTTLIGTGPATDEEAFPQSHRPPGGAPTPEAPPAADRGPATERQPEPPFDGASTAPSLQPPEPPNRPSTQPLKRPTPPPPPAATPPPPMRTTAIMSNPPPLPERARRSVPNQLAAAATTTTDGSRVSESHVPAAVVAKPSTSARPSGPHQTGTSGRPTPPPVPVARKYVPKQEEPEEEEENDDARAQPDVSSPLPPPPRVHRSLLAEIEDDRDRVRGPSASMPDAPPSRRRGVGGFIVAAVVIVCVLMLGAVWAQKNLGLTFGTKPQPTALPTVDPRVASFLTNGEKALADGNLELAKESLDKASALAEKDPHVLLALARLSAVRADVLWLKSRLLPSDAADEHRITREGLTEQAAAARKAAEEAIAAAPDDPNASRARMDALRISGDRDGARALVPKIAAVSTQPESAYVLAALDLAEAEPLWPTVIERLKTASGSETGPGRARAALVFALVRSGDAVGAKAEVDRLSAMPRQHPLFPLLKGFADRAKGPVAKLDGGVGDASVAMEGFDAGKAGHAAGGGGGGGGGGMPTDPRELVAQGERARAKGDFERARTLFTAAVDKNPNDSEALSGLAAISYSQRDLVGARASYKRVLAINPNYMPALVGLADVEWDSGDKAGAAKMYKDIVDRYPEGAYPGRVKQRSEGGG